MCKVREDGACTALCGRELSDGTYTGVAEDDGTGTDTDRCVCLEGWCVMSSVRLALPCSHMPHAIDCVVWNHAAVTGTGTIVEARAPASMPALERAPRVAARARANRMARARATRVTPRTATVSVSPRPVRHARTARASATLAPTSSCVIAPATGAARRATRASATARRMALGATRSLASASARRMTPGRVRW